MHTTTRRRYAAPRKSRTPLLAVLLILGLMVAGCAGTAEAELDKSTDPVPTADETAEPAPKPEPVKDEPKPTPEPEPEPSTGAVGDTATITQDWGDGAAEGTITVSAVEVTTRPYDEYGEAPKHGVFVIFTVDVTAEGVFEVYEGDFYIRVADGTRYDVGDGNAFDAADYDDHLGWIDLNAGEKKSGLLVFDVPTAAGVLAYAPNYDGGPIVEWAFEEGE